MAKLAHRLCLFSYYAWLLNHLILCSVQGGALLVSVDPGIFDYATIRLRFWQTGTGCFRVIPCMFVSTSKVGIKIRNCFPGILSIFL